MIINNLIGNNFTGNVVTGLFFENKVGSDCIKNKIHSTVQHNIFKNNFRNNTITGEISYKNLVNATYIYQEYPKHITQDIHNNVIVTFYGSANETIITSSYYQFDPVVDNTNMITVNELYTYIQSLTPENVVPFNKVYVDGIKYSYKAINGTPAAGDLLPNQWSADPLGESIYFPYPLSQSYVEYEHLKIVSREVTKLLIYPITA